MMITSLHNDIPALGFSPDTFCQITGVIVRYAGEDGYHFGLIGTGECVAITAYFLAQSYVSFDDEIQLEQLRLQFASCADILARVYFFRLTEETVPQSEGGA